MALEEQPCRQYDALLHLSGSQCDRREYFPKTITFSCINSLCQKSFIHAASRTARSSEDGASGSI